MARSLHRSVLAPSLALTLACGRFRTPDEDAKAVVPPSLHGVRSAPAEKNRPALAFPAKIYRKPSDEELERRLTPLEYEVTRHAATEPPFQNRFFDHHSEGLYVDIVSGEPLFSSRDKFDSGSGWPSFTRPLDPERVIARPDESHGMKRTEVRSRDGDSHLGHLFNDGPAPSGLRYCVNSAALRFIPTEELAQAGYADYLPLFRGAKSEAPVSATQATSNACTAPAPGAQPGCSSTLETAVLAGGCFWGMEEILRKIPGVLSTEVGYTGGAEGVNYEAVHTGTTGNAEAVRIVFDPRELSFEALLEHWFFRMHDPTKLNRQGNDVGTQYRSAIFVTSPEQRAVAERVKARVDRSGVWGAPAVTEIADAKPFTLAEDYHQDYLQKNPGGYTCHYLRDFPNSREPERERVPRATKTPSTSVPAAK